MHQMPVTNQSMVELANDGYSYEELQQDLADIIDTANLEQGLTDTIDAANLNQPAATPAAAAAAAETASSSTADASINAEEGTQGTKTNGNKKGVLSEKPSRSHTTS